MILRICVVIPVFDNPRTISRVTRDVVRHVPYPVLIVDDGSETPVANVLYSFEVKEAIERGRVRVVRFDKRLGKGAAVRYAMRDLAAAGYTHVMTIDGDGRHSGGELTKLVEVGRAHPWDLIIGRRQTNAPARETWWARLVRRTLEMCVSFETGARIEDPQSGFRLYPLFPLQTMTFRTNNYDFDLEVLIRALWHGVRVREVPVDVVEPDALDRVQHFNRWTDGLRISVLNLILIAVTLLRTRSNPRELAWALGLGVFIGCTPLLGFHAAAAVGLAMMLRLNVVALLIGSRVSTPILLPFIVLASVYIGQHWLHIPQSTGLMSHVYRWAAGSLVLGTGLGVITGLAAYAFAKSAQNPRPVGHAARGGQRILKLVATHGGPRLTRAWATVVAIYYATMSNQVRRGLRQFHRLLTPRAGRWCLYRRRVGHVRRYVELQADHYRAPAARFEAGRQVTRPTTIVTAHLGDWDVGRRAADLTDVDFVTPDRSGPAPRFELISFLGALAVFDVAEFHRAALEHRTLTVAFATRQDANYVVHLRPPREYAFRPDVAPELQVYEWASRFVLQLEFMVKAHPDQWTQLYPFWSTGPDRSPEAADVVHQPIEDLPGPTRLKPVL